MKDYFRILGVEPGASENEIKKAYRRKALQYHPDRNPEKDTSQKFIEITEAYEMLISGEWKARYSRNKEDVQQPKRGRRGPMTEQEFEERLRKAKEMARRKANIQYQEYQKLKRSFIYRIFPYLSALYILFGISMIVDYYSTEKEMMKIIQVESNDGWLRIYVEDGDDIRILNINEFYGSHFMGGEVEVSRSLLYDQITNLHFTSLGVSYGMEITNYRSLHVGLWYILLVMFLPILSFFYIGPRPQFYFLLHLNTYLPAFTIIIMLLLHYNFFFVS